MNAKEVFGVLIFFFAKGELRDIPSHTTLGTPSVKLRFIYSPDCTLHVFNSHETLMKR